MPEKHTPPSITELLKHAAWTRHLARGLVESDAAADDVAQDARVAALRRPPDTTRPVRPWLGTVVRNNIYNRSRQHARREEREAHGEARETLESPERLLERLELHKLLVEIVSELAEPYRRTILLSYFDELASAEIGARENIPASTVRGRLKTALELLRDALDLRLGRGTWLPAVANLCRPPSAATPAVPAVGAKIGAAQAAGGTSSLSSVTVVVIVAAVAVTTGAVLHHRQAAKPEGVALDEDAAPVAVPVRADEPRSPQHARERNPSAGHPTAPASPPSAAAASNALDPPTAQPAIEISAGLVRGVVLAGGPDAVRLGARLGRSGGVVGAVVRIVAGAPAQRTESPEATQLSIEHGRFPSRVQLVPVDESIAVANYDEVAHGIRLSRGTVGLSRVELAARHKTTRLKLPVGTEILQVTVEDTSEHVFVARSDNAFSALTDSTGAFVLRDVPDGHYLVEVWDEALGTQTVDLTMPAADPRLLVVFGAEPVATPPFADGGKGPCTIARTADTVVKACASGGRSEATKLMKNLVKQARARGERFTCDHCHKDLDTYALTSNARDDFDKLLTIAGNPAPRP